ncbi:MAG: tetratricopeptide repeat protein [Microbacterium sp.]
MNDADAQRVGAVMQRSDLLALQNREEEAIALLDEALVDDPENPRLLTQRGRLLHLMGHDQAAIDTLTRSLAQAPDDLRTLHFLSTAHRAVGHLDEAEAANQRCLDGIPHNPTFHLQRAQILTLRARRARRGAATKMLRKEAFRHVERALESVPDDANTYGWAAQIARELGRLTEAKLYVERGSLSPPTMRNSAPCSAASRSRRRRATTPSARCGRSSWKAPTC